MKSRKIIALIFFVCSMISLRAQTYWQDTLVTGLISPVAFDFAPDGRIFVTQKGGTVQQAVNANIKVYSPSGNFLGIFYDLSDSVDADFERGLLGIAIDPDFTTNHFVYVYYVHLLNGDEHIRIARFTENNNTGTNPAIIFDIDVPDNLPGIHFGGNLHFRPSEPNQLYFTIGDLGSDQYDSLLNNAPKLNSYSGKTLRINKDGTIPADNPFYDDGNIYTGNCDIIWSYGHRNPFDFCFSPVSDSFYCSENGLITWDEMNMIHRGREYGWNECEGYYLNGSTTQLCDDTSAVAPMADWGAPLPAVTGILYYSGTVMPEFDNHLLVADNDYGQIYDLALGNAPFYDTVLSKTTWIDLTPGSGGLTTLRQGSDGCIYAMHGGYAPDGSIIRVCPSWMSVEENANPYAVELQAAPNPFGKETTISYRLLQETTVSLRLYDAFGRLVAVLVSEQEQAGMHTMEINAEQLGLAAGTYCCVLTAGTSVGTVKLEVGR